MAIQFTRNGRKAMLWAQVEAMRRGDLHVEPEHLILGLVHGEGTGALRLLARVGVDAAEVRAATVPTLSPESGATRVETSQLSPSAKKVVEQARRETETTEDDYVGTEHLLLAILKSFESGVMARDGMKESLTKLGLHYETAAQAARDKSFTPEASDTTESVAVSAPLPRPVSARPGFLKGRHVLGVGDLATDEIRALFEMTREIKMGKCDRVAEGKTLALVFEKPSLRTRVTFSVAMTRLGGNTVYLGRDEIGLGTRESVEDVARGLSRWVDAVAARTFSDASVRGLAANGTVPIINALSDREHPCQALADFYTILESRSETAGQKLVYVGDGNNVSNSLMLLAPRMGTHFTLCCPEGYEPDPALIAETEALARAHGTRFEISHDPLVASDDADILYTDVWTSMGQEAETAKRLKDFAGFQVSADLIREAKDDVLVLHCLPAHRGEEIAGDVIDGPHSGVWDQAENRLHVQQALLASIL